MIAFNWPWSRKARLEIPIWIISEIVSGVTPRIKSNKCPADKEQDRWQVVVTQLWKCIIYEPALPRPIAIPVWFIMYTRYLTENH